MRRTRGLQRLDHGRPGIPVTLFVFDVFDVFDVLAVEGLPTTMQPFSERRALLEQLELESRQVRLVATFEDAEALFAAVCERDLEGITAKCQGDPYRPAERRWLKVTNKAIARFAEELDGVGRRGGAKLT